TRCNVDGNSRRILQAVARRLSALIDRSVGVLAERFCPAQRTGTSAQETHAARGGELTVIDAGNDLTARDRAHQREPATERHTKTLHGSLPAGASPASGEHVRAESDPRQCKKPPTSTPHSLQTRCLESPAPKAP